MRNFKERSTSSLGFKEGSFVYTIVPIGEKDPPGGVTTYAAIASDDSLAFFNVGKNDITVQQRIENVHEGVSCLLSCLSGRNEDQPFMVTAGRDGRVKCWNGSGKSLSFVELRTPKGEGVSALACCRMRNLVAAGTELVSQGPGDVAIYIWDMCKPLNPPIRQYVESHTDTITQLTFQGTSESSLLFSGSTDGLVNTFNTAIEDEDDALVSVVNNKSAVQVFTPGIAQNSICILSADEQVAVYSLLEDSTSDADVKPWDLREKFECDYAISMLNTGSEIVLAVGANKSETTSTPYVDLLLSEDTSRTECVAGTHFKPAIRLHGAHGEEVVRDIYFGKEVADDLNFILTCGEDGLVRVWEDQNVRSTTIGGAQSVIPGDLMEGVEGEPKKEKRTKRRGGKADEKKRFKPY